MFNVTSCNREGTSTGRLRKRLVMHIHAADARRRAGRTTWSEYGRQAAAAEGKWVRRRETLSGKRDLSGRLRELGGLQFVDIAPMLSEDTKVFIRAVGIYWQHGRFTLEQADDHIRRLIKSDLDAQRAWAKLGARAEDREHVMTETFLEELTSGLFHGGTFGLDILP
jgi:hypothetical protein